ncbi:MAG: hypothetical protein LIO99_06945 [Clostridiales bacterium]|nr:hypothetical protein [Clostridiales bacterium]
MAGKDKDNKQNSHPDECDMLVAYHPLQKDMETQNIPRKKTSSECSTLEAILYMIGGLVAMGFIFSLLGVDAYDVPAILLLLLWFIFAIIIMVIVISIGSRKQ